MAINMSLQYLVGGSRPLLIHKIVLRVFNYALPNDLPGKLGDESIHCSFSVACTTEADDGRRVRRTRQCSLNPVVHVTVILSVQRMIVRCEGGKFLGD